MKKLFSIVLILFLASCANAPKTGQGAAIGGAGGAAVGAAISRATGGSGWTGAAIGAVVGTVAGAIIGNTQDQKASGGIIQTSYDGVKENFTPGPIIPGHYDYCDNPKKINQCKKDAHHYFQGLSLIPDGKGRIMQAKSESDEFTWKTNKNDPSLIDITITSKKLTLKDMREKAAAAWTGGEYDKGTKLQAQAFQNGLVFLEGEYYIFIRGI